MKFRTELKPGKGKLTLDPEHPVTMLGSCFSDNIGRKMRSLLWDARVNSCGVVFNPVVIEKLLQLASLFPAENHDHNNYGNESEEYDIEKIMRALDNRESADREAAEKLREYALDCGEYCLNYLFSSKFAGETVEDALLKCVWALRRLKRDIEDSDALILTLGSAYVYRLKERRNIAVGNCHKRPAADFDVQLLHPKDVTDLLDSIFNIARKMNPRIKMVVTVSPVRHLGNNPQGSFSGNIISKANLIAGTLEFLKHHSEEETAYFPAYEIMIDDLRDYRWYADDLLHPSDKAVEYIWEKFRDCHLDGKGIALLAEAENIVRSLCHRPIVGFTRESLDFALAAEDAAMNFNMRHAGMLSARGEN